MYVFGLYVTVVVELMSSICTSMWKGGENHGPSGDEAALFGHWWGEEIDFGIWGKAGGLKEKYDLGQRILEIVNIEKDWIFYKRWERFGDLNMGVVGVARFKLRKTLRTREKLKLKKKREKDEREGPLSDSKNLSSLSTDFPSIFSWRFFPSSQSFQFFSHRNSPSDVISTHDETNNIKVSTRSENGCELVRS